MSDNTNFAALVGSRICHDLISPVGAIGNGLELVELSGSLGSGPEIDLITESVTNANARIRFFRVAFGMAAGEQMVGEAEIRSILAGLSQGARLDVQWHPQGAVRRPDLRVIFLALMCAETVVPFGGTADVTQDDAGVWTVSITGDKLRVDDALWGALGRCEAPEQITPAQVQFGLLPVIAREQGRELKLTQTDTQIDLRF